MTEAESVGRALLRRAGVRPERPGSAGALDVAFALYGGDVLRVSKRAQFEGSTATINGERKIVVAPMSPRRMHWAVAKMLARFELTDLACWSASLEQAVAAYLVAPTESVRALGVELDQLADAHAITETCAALRLVECGRVDGVVVTPVRVHRPASTMAWIGDAEARRLAASNPRSLKKVRIGDEPGRVALFR